MLGLNNVCIGLRRSKRYLSTAAKLVLCSVNISNSGPSRCGSGLVCVVITKRAVSQQERNWSFGSFRRKQAAIPANIGGIQCWGTNVSPATTVYISTLKLLSTTIFAVYPFYQLSQLLWTKSVYRVRYIITSCMLHLKYPTCSNIILQIYDIQQSTSWNAPAF